MNTLPATLTAITSSEHLTCLNVRVGDDTFCLLLAEQCHDAVGTSLTLAFKETEVLLASSLVATTANIHSATIAKIEQGSVLTQIILNYQGGSVIAIVPALSFGALGCSKGEEIFWMVSPSEISLLGGHHGD